MNIRKLTLQDVDRYRSLRLQGLQEHKEAFGSSYEEEMASPMEKFIKRLTGENTITFGAFVEETLVGVVTLLMETRNKTSHKGSIVGMYVNKIYHHQGIGVALLKEAIAVAKSNSIEQLHLAVTSTNLPAISLYQSLGFITYGKEPHALKVQDSYYDEDLMVLFLES